MEWIKLHLHVIRSEEYIGCEPVQRATYINLLAYCVDQETMGRISGCASWSNRKWMQLCGVMKDEIDPCALFWFDGDDLCVFAYPEEEQRSCESKREKCRIAQLKRWEKERSRSPSKSPNTEKRREEKKREDIDFTPQDQEHKPIPPVDVSFWLQGKIHAFKKDVDGWFTVLSKHGMEPCTEAYNELEQNGERPVYPNKLDDYLATKPKAKSKVEKYTEYYGWAERLAKKLTSEEIESLLEGKALYPAETRLKQFTMYVTESYRDDPAILELIERQ